MTIQQQILENEREFNKHFIKGGRTGNNVYLKFKYKDLKQFFTESQLKLVECLREEIGKRKEQIAEQYGYGQLRNGKEEELEFILKLLK